MPNPGLVKAEIFWFVLCSWLVSERSRLPYPHLVRPKVVPFQIQGRCLAILVSSCLRQRKIPGPVTWYDPSQSRFLPVEQQSLFGRSHNLFLIAADLLHRAWMRPKCHANGRRTSHRPYRPISSVSPRICPFMTRSSSAFLAPAFRLSFVSSAYSLKLYRCALPGGGHGPS